MLARNQYAALFRNVGSKAACICSGQYRVQLHVFKHRRTGFFIGLISQRLTGKQAQFPVTSVTGSPHPFPD
jgi:hypothetical protein